MVTSRTKLQEAGPPLRRRRDRPAWATVVAGPSLLDDLGGELDELHAATGVPITARRRWLSHWADAFASWQPWAVLVRDPGTGDLEGAALLAWKARLGMVELMALGSGPSDYVRLPAVDAAAATRLATEVAAELRSLRGPWRLRMAELPLDDAVATALVAQLPNSRLEAGDPSPATEFTAGRSINGYTSGKFRTQTRAKRKQLAEAAGDVDIRFTNDPGTIAELRPRLEAVRLERDVQRGRLGDLDTAEGSAFWWAVLPALAEVGELELATLWAGDELAAYSVALLDGPAYRSWDFRMSPRFARYNPGQILDFAVIERVLADGRFTVLDRMRGEEPYKMRTANVVVPGVALTAWSSAAFKGLDLGTVAFKARVRRADRLIGAWRLVRRRFRGQVPPGDQRYA